MNDTNMNSKNTPENSKTPAQKFDDKYFKPANPDDTFDRFMNRQKHEPSEMQLEKWEDEGGVTPIYNTEYGWFENDPFSRKVVLFLKKILQKMSSNVAPKNLQPRRHQKELLTH